MSKKNDLKFKLDNTNYSIIKCPHEIDDTYWEAFKYSTTINEKDETNSNTFYVFKCKSCGAIKISIKSALEYEVRQKYLKND